MDRNKIFTDNIIYIINIKNTNNNKREANNKISFIISINYW